LAAVTELGHGTWIWLTVQWELPSDMKETIKTSLAKLFIGLLGAFAACAHRHVQLYLCLPISAPSNLATGTKDEALDHAAMRGPSYQKYYRLNGPLDTGAKNLEFKQFFPYTHRGGETPCYRGYGF